MWQIFEKISLGNFMKQKSFISEVWPKIRARVKFMYLVLVIHVGSTKLCYLFHHQRFVFDAARLFTTV